MAADGHPTGGAVVKKITPESTPDHPRLSGIEITNDRLTSRAGLALFARYLDRIDFLPLVASWLGPVRKNAKGLPAAECIRQVLLFFVDATSRHLTYFDELSTDEGYAGTIERDPDDLLSSHSVKRFFGAISWGRIWLLRRLLQELFIWRLNLARPKVVILDLDAMVMDNNEARAREGVVKTYKRVRGFAPLQMVWGRVVVDAVFRAGNHHSNHKDTTEKMVRHVVRKIRKRYAENVPIIIRQDGGYFDQKLFDLYESLDVGYLSGGRLYGDIKEFISGHNELGWNTYINDQQEWKYLEIGDRRRNWDCFRRLIFCRPTYEDRQMVLEFARPDTVIYTNLGMGTRIDEMLREAGVDHLIQCEALIESYHDRGFDELVHRAFKDFVDQRLPFKRFRQNTAYYYTALLAFALFEAFKADVTDPVIPETAYATTFRRRFLDIAGKIVSHSNRITLKVSRSVFERLQLDRLWLLCSSPPRLPQIG
jgi:hypothetical protein